MNSTISHSTLPQGKKEKKSKLKSYFKSMLQIFKKFIDDEVWYMFRSLFSNSVSKLADALIMGSLMSFVFFQEGYSGIKDGVKAALDPNAEQRKTRIAVGALIGGAAATGLGLIGTLVAEQFGAEVLGTIFVPVILPALMVVIYGAALSKHAYRLKVIREKEQEEKAIYEEQLLINQRKSQELNRRIESYKQQCRLVQEQLDAYLSKKSQGLEISATEEKKHTENVTALIHFDEQVKICETRLTQIETENETHKQRYLPFFEERLKAERKVAFAAIEVGTSAILLVSAILGASFIVGASVASMGTFAFALLAAGLLIGGAVKLFQFIDKKCDYRCTKWIRGLFTRSPKPKNELVNEHQNEINLSAGFKATQPIDIPGSTKDIISSISSKDEVSSSPSSPVDHADNDQFLERKQEGPGWGQYPDIPGNWEEYPDIPVRTTEDIISSISSKDEVSSPPSSFDNAGINQFQKRNQEGLDWDQQYPNFSPPNRNRFFNPKEETYEDARNSPVVNQPKGNFKRDPDFSKRHTM